MAFTHLFEAARAGDVDVVRAALDADPLQLHVRDDPYAWTLLHHAAHRGHLAVVDLLLERGFDANTKERGDQTTALHWAAAAGHADVVRRLLEAGANPKGFGDDHELGAIGWATAWDGCDDEAHRAVVDLLLQYGARHHIFSAIAMNLGDEVRRIVEADRATLRAKMSHNEGHQRPLHFAVRKDRVEMVSLLLELGADLRATDDAGFTAAACAVSVEAARRLHAALRQRGARDLLTALTIGDFEDAEAIVAADPPALSSAGALHLAAKRGDVAVIRWLLARGADPNRRWAHWDSDVTPLHLAVLGNHLEAARALVERGADPAIRDSKHDGDAVGWARFFERPGMVSLFTARA